MVTDAKFVVECDSRCIELWYGRLIVLLLSTFNFNCSCRFLRSDYTGQRSKSSESQTLYNTYYIPLRFLTSKNQNINVPISCAVYKNQNDGGRRHSRAVIIENRPSRRRQWRVRIRCKPCAGYCCCRRVIKIHRSVLHITPNHG